MFLLASLWLVVGCCKDKKCKGGTKDYRDKYIGTYDFTTIDFVRWHDLSQPYPYPPIIIDDTTNYIGTIEKHEVNSLKIIFKPNATYNYVSDGLIYLIVDSCGIFYDTKSHDNFNGSLSDNKISIKYSDKLAYMGFSSTEIQGIKIK
ncbi:MAG: hypothetical protein FWE63_05220 [Bacteroidales bacterium]|nr:hypothetical protein [Bacteroidales bacterium]